MFEVKLGWTIFWCLYESARACDFWPIHFCEWWTLSCFFLGEVYLTRIVMPHWSYFFLDQCFQCTDKLLNVYHWIWSAHISLDIGRILVNQSNIAYDRTLCQIAYVFCNKKINMAYLHYHFPGQSSLDIWLNWNYRQCWLGQTTIQPTLSTMARFHLR